MLSVNIREGYMTYYDPLKNYKFLEDILISAFKFLKDEMWFFENKMIDETRWRNIYYLKLNETTKFDEADSALYVIKHIKNIALAEKEELVPNKISEIRNEILEMMIKYGNKTKLY
jgi:Ulp1 protease family, C-terminal catalytic domain